MSGFPLDGLDRVHANVELNALCHQAVDELAVRAVGTQQRDARTEGYDFDCDPVRTVEFEQVVSDADDQALLFGVVVGELQDEVVVGKGLVGERIVLGR